MPPRSARTLRPPQGSGLFPRLACCLLSAFLLHPAKPLATPAVEWWSSTEDLQFKLASQPAPVFSPNPTPTTKTIRLDPTAARQSILGLGSSLEHSSCYNLSRLPAPQRDQVLESLLLPDRGIGMSLMRLCIGTPDFTASPWYTYNDLPPGDTDPGMTRFSIEKDRAYVLPVLKAALRIRPDLQFFASPWSPPGWMKTNGRIPGGRIDPTHFAAYAEYLARFIEAYRAEGIEIHAITLQNEPEYAPDTYPTCLWTAAEQRDFIRDHLGPLFEKRRLKTRIWCFDHNFEHPEFPATILADPAAARFVDGTAFHHYVGQPEAMRTLQQRFPDKHLYFTEGSTFGSAGAEQVLRILRNGARSYNAWVTLIDHRKQPNPGPHPCSLTAVVLHSDTLKTEYRFDYYMYGHFMKFIQPGAVRLDSTGSKDLPTHAAFRNRDGSIVLVAANSNTTPRILPVEWNRLAFAVTLAPKSVHTFRWRP